MQLIERGIAPLAGIREALNSIECAAEIGNAWQLPPGAPLLSGACRVVEPVQLDEAAAKVRLAEYGVSVPQGAAAYSEDETVAVAASIGGAVAVKALGVSHKSDQDAVRLGLCGPDEIRGAARELLAIGEGVLVERFETGIVAELIVGLHRDSQFGLLLTVGSGGILVELAADAFTVLLPVDESEIRAALSGLRCAPLLAGWRGREGADLDAAVAAIRGVVEFAEANCDRIEELDVNPLGVRAEGQGAVAIDALIRIRESRT